MLNNQEAAFGLAKELADHKGGDVVVLDLGPCQTWTDYFVVATATSSTHLRGLARAADEWAHLAGVERRNTPRIADDEAWVLIDMGNVVLHLMTADARVFYELEKLWFQAVATKVESGPPPAAAPKA